MKFLAEFLPTVASRLPPESNVDTLVAAGNALVKFTNIIDSQPRKLSDAVCSELQTLAELHVGLAEAAGIPMLPKHHMFRHLAAQLYRKGNPRYYNTYWDESTNAVIANVAATTHRARFERMVFRKYGYLSTEGPPHHTTGVW